MTPRDELLIGLWALSIVASVAIVWTPWRLTRRDATIDLSGQLTGRPISRWQVFVTPALLLIGPIVFLGVGGGGTSVLSRLHALFPNALVPIAAVPAVQLLLRREILRVWSQKEAERERAQAVLSRGKSARRPMA